MKINFKKAIQITIAVGMVTIVGLSTIWFGTDPYYWVVVGVFAAGAIAIGISVYYTRKKK